MRAVALQAPAAKARPIVPFSLAMRERLLAFMLDYQTSQGLSEWLRALGVDAYGTVEEKEARIRQHTNFVHAPPLAMLAEVMEDLCEASASSVAELCIQLGVPADATKPTLLRRLHRFIAVHEGMLPPHSPVGPAPAISDVYQFVKWYPLYQGRSYERDHYREFRDAMTDIFGQHHVHQEVGLEGGGKIDFHIGPLAPGQAAGVGVEFKMPASNSDVQKASGQLDQYQRRYGNSLIVVIFPDLIDQKYLQPFFHSLASRDIAYVVKRTFWEEVAAG